MKPEEEEEIRQLTARLSFTPFLVFHFSTNMYIVLGPVVRKVDSVIHRIVIFSTVVKMLEKL